MKAVVWFLNLLDKHSRPALVGGVFIGVLLPDLAAALRPFAIPAVLGCLVGALLLMDWSTLLAHFKRARIITLLLGWQLLVTPALAWLLGHGLQLSTELQQILLLQFAAAPIGSAAVFLLLLGLDGGLALLVSALSVLLLPLTLTLTIAVLGNGALDIELIPFFLRACVMILAPVLTAIVLRKLIGATRVRAHSKSVSGLNVTLLIVFAIGVMEGVSEEVMQRPASAAMLFITAWLVALVLHGSAFLAFRRHGLDVAFSAAVMSGNRNLGLMLAVTAGLTSRSFELYVGIAQIPMYCVPLLLAPLVQRAYANRSQKTG